MDLVLTPAAAWTAWTPNLTAGGSMTISGSASLARYRLSGKTLEITLSIAGTLGGSASATVLISLPAGLTAQNGNGYHGATGTDGDGTVIPSMVARPNSTSIVLYKDIGCVTNYATGASFSAYVNLVCEIA